MTVGSVSAVRQANLGLVLRTVRELAPCSRAAVASATGLNKTTVSSLVADLMARGLIRETGLSSRQRVGRPGVLLSLDDTSLAAIGLEVNVDYLALVAVDLLDRELLNVHIPFDARAAGAKASVQQIATVLREFTLDPVLAERRIIGVGVAIPGLIDAPSGAVTYAPNLGWQDLELRKHLTDLLAIPELPVLVDNDANLGAIAEYRVGAYSGTPDLVYVTGEVGIGAGVLTNGSLLRGASGFAGEIGHVPLDANGPECGCGRHGCVEALAGIDAILHRAVPDKFPDRPLSGKDITDLVTTAVKRAETGDTAAIGAIQSAGTWLGHGLAMLVNITNPRLIVLGGYFVPMGPWLLERARSAAAEDSFAPDTGGCRIELSTLGLSAAARGGAASMIYALDSGDLPLPVPRSSVAGR